MKDKPLLSIIIVKYRAEDYLKQCLESLVLSIKYYVLRAETIVVDNDKENIGYGAGCNKGAKKARGKYLFFLNPDTIILKGTLKAMIDYMEKNPQIGVLGPKIYKNFKKEKQLSFCRFPDPLTSLFVFSPIRSFWPDSPLFNHYVYSENKIDNGVLDVEAVAGAAILVRRDVFEKVAGFDEKFFLYFEENDLCRRIRKLGGRIVYFPEAEIVHFGDKSTIDVEKASRTFKKSRFYFFRKHYGTLVALFTEGLARVLETLATGGLKKRTNYGLLKTNN